jgi:hypothetical protein
MADTISDISGWTLTEDNLSESNTAPYTPPEFTSPSGPSIPFGNIIGAGASLMGGIGAYMEGKEKQEADEYNANIALMKGTFDVEQLGLEESSMLATQRAVYARAGVEMSGSPLDVALSTATQFEYSKQVADFNAQSQANMDEYEGKVAAQQGEFGLAGGILGAIGKLI